MLGAFCMFLSALDYLIPKPLPFMRIGLANLPILLALDLLSPANYCRLVLLKVLGQGLITGALFSYVFLFSLAGSAASAAIMYGLRRGLGKKFISFMGIGLAGAFVSNSVQLVMARFFVFGESALYLAPPFLAAGIVSGTSLGLFAKAFSVQSRWFRSAALSPSSPGMPDRIPKGEPAKSPRPPGMPGVRQKFLSGLRFFGGLGAMVLFLLVPSLALKAALFALFWLLAAAAGKKTRPVLTIAVIGGVVFCNLFPPYGKVLVQAGPLSVTLGSLTGGLRKAVTLEGLVMLSRVFVSPGFTLPGSFGRLLGKSFRILEKLNARKGKITGRRGPQNGRGTVKKNRLMEALDELLLELTEKA
ncbi:MAG: Gx transporter family protein [Spirochaetaceae bacterium]|nr:Gx transporter family protein [Spirochaetaceae bacterium]